MFNLKLVNRLVYYFVLVGIDVGGVSREMFGCLCDQLFGADSNDGLFMRFNDECMQSLVSECIHHSVCKWLG